MEKGLFLGSWARLPAPNTLHIWVVLDSQHKEGQQIEWGNSSPERLEALVSAWG